MLERFTREARAVVAASRERAITDRSAEIGEEHLLLAILDQQGSGLRLLTDAGLTGDPADLRRDLEATRRRGGVTDADAAALRDIGVDVDQVVAAVERSLGAGALDGRQPRGPRRRAPGGGMLSGAARAILAAAVRQAVDLRAGHIGEEHLVLALLDRPGAVHDVLASHGATLAAARAAVLRRAS